MKQKRKQINKKCYTNFPYNKGKFKYVREIFIIKKIDVNN